MRILIKNKQIKKLELAERLCNVTEGTFAYSM